MGAGQSLGGENVIAKIANFFIVVNMQISSAASVKKKASGSVLTTPVALPGRQKRSASVSDSSKTSLKPQGSCRAVISFFLL